MSKSVAPIVLKETDANHLNSIVAGTVLAGADIVKRAKSLLLLAEGKQIKDIAFTLGYRENTVTEIRRRFLKEGISSLEDHPRSGRPRTLLGRSEIEEQIDSYVEKYQAEHSMIPSVRTVATELNGSENTVREVMKSKGYIQGKRNSWEFVSNDSLNPVIVNVIGIYLSCKQYAIVVKTQDAGTLPGSCEQGTIIPLSNKTASALSAVTTEQNYIDMATALNTFVINKDDGKNNVSRSSTMSCSAFIESAIACNSAPNARYSILTFGDPILEKQRSIISDTVVQKVETTEEWICKAEELFELVFTPRRNYDLMVELITGIEKYIRYANQNTAPFIWKKSVLPDDSKPMTDEIPTHPEISPGTVEVTARIMGDNGEWITATVQAESNTQIKDFNTETMEGYLNSADVIEKTIAVATHEAAGALNQRYLAEVVKKNR